MSRKRGRGPSWEAWGTSVILTKPSCQFRHFTPQLVGQSCRVRAIFLIDFISAVHLSPRGPPSRSGLLDHPIPRPSHTWIRAPVLIIPLFFSFFSVEIPFCPPGISLINPVRSTTSTVRFILEK